MSLTWAERYGIAQSILLADDAVANGAVFPHWIDDDSFWYRRDGHAGAEYVVVDAATGKRRRCADVAELVPPAGDPSWAVSPDGNLAIVARGPDLCVRDLAAGTERVLTADGTADNPYARKPAMLRRRAEELGWPMRPEGRWSPDSTRFLTHQIDERHVPDLPLIDFAPRDGVRPVVSSIRTSLPGESRVSEFRLVSLDVETGRQTEARYPRLPTVRMNETLFAAGLAWWAADGRTAYFVDVERGERAAHVVAFDVVTGATRVVFTETADTYVELGVDVYGPALIRPLPETGELVWYSERTGHGHLYRYDLATGAPRNAITSGPWQVREVLHVDPVRREVLFLAGGIDPAGDPYERRPCVAGLDGGPVSIRSDEPGDHLVWRPGETILLSLAGDGDDPHAISGVSPDGRYFVETVGAADRLPRTVLRRRDGEQVAELETGQDRGLPAGWTWPEPVALTAADGHTPIHGLLFPPWDYDPARSYPLIDYVYGGPQLSYVPKSAFAQDGRGTDVQYLEAAHLSALGAFVLILDGRGTAFRERAFREFSYGAMHTASDIDDHIAGIRELARRRPAIDVDRVGVTGISGGGYAATLAALRRGEFFKVAVAASANYDQSLFWRTWGERYHGAHDPERYRAQAAKTYVDGLRGKLLLMHGLLDAGCHPGGLFQFVQALIDRNKDVDLVILPRGGHAYDGYGTRRRLDYLVTHLFGSTPPVGVAMTTAAEQRALETECPATGES